MGTTESTHEVAQKTDGSGKTARVETERVETSQSHTSSKPKPAGEGEAKQVKPDGR